MWRALGMNITAFSILFLLHILFASQDFDLAFSVVALFISLQVILFGPLTVVLEGANLRNDRRRTNQVSFLLALPLSLGLAWAYGGMAWSVPAGGVIVGTTLLFHMVLDRQLSLD